MGLPAPYDRLLIPIYLPSALMAVVNQAMLLLLPLYALELSGNAAFAALLVGLRGFGLLMFDVPAGVLVGRFGDRRVLFGGLATLAVSTLALAVATEPWISALLVIPLGAGQAAWFLGWLSYITDSCAPEERGRATSAVAGIQRFGAFAGPLAGGLIAQSFGYPAAFLVGAVVAASAAAVSFLFTDNVHPARPAEAGSIRSIGRLLVRNRGVFATAGAVALVFQLMRAVRQLLVPLYGVVVGLDAGTIGLIYALSAALDMSLFYPVGIAVDRWGRKAAGIPSMLVFVLGLTLLPFAQGFYTLLAAGLTLGLANGLSVGLVQLIGMDLAPAQARGQFLGVWRLITDAGWAGGPLLAGILVDAVSLSAASFAVAGLGVLGGLVFLFLVPETLHIARGRAPPQR